MSEQNVAYMNMEKIREVKNDNMKSLAFRVLLSRRDLGWDQETLADKAGISRGYISKLERGYTKNPGIEVIKALANALGISTEYLIGSTDDPLFGVKEETEDEQESVANFLKDLRIDYAALDLKTLSLLQRLLVVFFDLSPRDQMMLVRMAESMQQAEPTHILGNGQGVV